MEQNGKVFAIISFVCGILGVLGIFCCGIGFLPGVVAIITAIISLKKQEAFKWMAIVGIICGAIGVLAGVINFAVIGIPTIVGMISEIANM